MYISFLSDLIPDLIYENSMLFFSCNLSLVCLLFQTTKLLYMCRLKAHWIKNTPVKMRTYFDSTLSAHWRADKKASPPPSKLYLSVGLLNCYITYHSSTCLYIYTFIHRLSVGNHFTSQLKPETQKSTSVYVLSRRRLVIVYSKPKKNEVGCGLCWC